MRYRKPLPQSFYSGSAKSVAQKLLGKVLYHKTKKGIISGYIVETESYGGKDDPASHAYKKITPRNSVMFGPPGYGYVYFCYGFHYLFNVITEKEGIPSAVLLRAIEPIEGIDIKTNGPGKLTRAFMIDMRYNKKPVFRDNLLILDSNNSNFSIVRKKRIGIKSGADKLLRFYIKDNPFVSKR